MDAPLAFHRREFVLLFLVPLVFNNNKQKQKKKKKKKKKKALANQQH